MSVEREYNSYRPVYFVHRLERPLRMDAETGVRVSKGEDGPNCRMLDILRMMSVFKHNDGHCNISTVSQGK